MKKLVLFSVSMICIMFFFSCKSKNNETIIALSHLPKTAEKCIKVEKLTYNGVPGYYICEYSISTDDCFEIITRNPTYDIRSIKVFDTIYYHYYVSSKEFSRLKLSVGESLPKGKFNKDFKRDSVLLMKKYFSEN